jgi:hypothetical protein
MLKLYRADIFSRFDIRCARHIRFEDVDLWGKVLLVVRKIFVLDEALYQYRIHDTSTITMSYHKRESVCLDQLLAFQDVLEFGHRVGVLDKAQRQMLANFLFHCWHCAFDMSADKKAYREQARYIVKKYYPTVLPDTATRALSQIISGKPYIRYDALSLLERICSITNVQGYKIFRLFGMEFAIPYHRRGHHHKKR